MIQSILESGMSFGPFEEENIFHVEKSPAYIAIRDHMKIAEFVSRNDNKILVVEAKATAPNPKSDTKPERFDEYIGEIEQKLCNALDLYFNQALCKALPSGFSQLDYKNLKVILALVIKEQLDEWLPPVKDALEKAINQHLRFSKIWKCSVVVLNEKRARGYGLIS